MSLRNVLPSACCVVFVIVGSALAHHTFSAVFNPAKRLTVTGTLVKTDWRNPHIELFPEAKNDRGQIETWMIEGIPVVWKARR